MKSLAELLREAEIDAALATTVVRYGAVLNGEDRKELVEAWRILFRLAGKAEAS